MCISLIKSRLLEINLEVQVFRYVVAASLFVYVVMRRWNMQLEVQVGRYKTMLTSLIF